VIRFDRFDLSFRTAYAQAKELALAQTQVPLLTAGSIQTEKRAGSRFVYRYRYDVTGKRIAEYLGPESDEKTAAKIQSAKDDIKDQEALAARSQALRKIGYYSADNSTLVTVASLFNAGIFGQGAVLVGTHAFGVILNAATGSTLAAAKILSDDGDDLRGAFRLYFGICAAPQSHRIITALFRDPGAAQKIAERSKKSRTAGPPIGRVFRKRVHETPMGLSQGVIG
jgi:hypothetical protein